MCGPPGRKHRFADCGIIPQGAIAQPGGIPPRIAADGGGDSQSLDRFADDLTRWGEEVRLVGTAEKLHKAWGFAVKQWHATPTPEALMQFSKLRVIGRAIRNEYECLRDRRTAIAGRLEEYRVCTITRRLLHHGDLFGRACVTAVSADGHKAIYSGTGSGSA
jgi:hypothetical protein